MDAYIDGVRFRLDPAKSIGKGGEADVFKIDPRTALKIFKQPDHPDLQGDPAEQAGAKQRLATHQRKLPAFPRHLPPHVVIPQKLAKNAAGSMIVGYTMPLVANAEVLLRYADAKWRQDSGIGPATVVDIFRDLGKTVDSLHKALVVIGDFNDLNILVSGTDAYLIDADSFQFGPYLCSMFTARFVDPLLCDAKASSPMLARPHTVDSDWYAYNVMLMQCLLYAGPYGGVYRPKRAGDRVDHDTRPLRRITVFHPEVKRPKVMLDPDILPDDLLQFWHLVFQKDKRGAFPGGLLDQLRWTTCPACKTEFARAVCPTCHIAPPAAVRQVIQVRGTVTATRIFHTSGVILYAAVHGGKLQWLFHHNNEFRRQDDAIVLNGALDPQMRFRLQGAATLVGKGDQLVTLEPGQPAQSVNVDQFGQLPIFDANEDASYWIAGGQLYHSDTLGPKYVGDVLASQTLIWVGPSFGFGFYRAGQMNVAFVYDSRARGINDTVQLPALKGHLVDATCAFSKDYCWFLVSTNAGGVTTNQCFVIDAKGMVRATAHAPDGDDSWLGTVRGKCAVGDSLLSATDDGIVRVRLDSGTIVVAQAFPDTEPFVGATSQLHAGREGLYVVGRNDITLLKIKTP